MAWSGWRAALCSDCFLLSTQSRKPWDEAHRFTVCLFLTYSVAFPVLCSHGDSRYSKVDDSRVSVTVTWTACVHSELFSPGCCCETVMAALHVHGWSSNTVAQTWRSLNVFISGVNSWWSKLEEIIFVLGNGYWRAVDTAGFCHNSLVAEQVKSIYPPRPWNLDWQHVFYVIECQIMPEFEIESAAEGNRLAAWGVALHSALWFWGQVCPLGSNSPWVGHFHAETKTRAPDSPGCLVLHVLLFTVWSPTVQTVTLSRHRLLCLRYGAPLCYLWART